MTRGKFGDLSITEYGIGMSGGIQLHSSGLIYGTELNVFSDHIVRLAFSYDGIDSLFTSYGRDLVIKSNNRNIYLQTAKGDVVLQPNGKIRLDGNIKLDSLVGQASNGDYLVYMDGGIGLVKSSRKYKKNIKDVDKKEIDYEALYNLPIRQFEFKDGIKGSGIDGVQIGFIADEVADVFPNAALRNKDGEPSNWTDRTLIPAMLKLIQEQKKAIDDLTSRVEKIEKLLAEKEG